MRELVIDRAIWLRGEGSVDSYLKRHSDGKQCCVGIYLAACGVPELSLAGAQTAREVRDRVPEEAKWLVGATSDEDVNELYADNDRRRIDFEQGEASREQVIAEQFLRHDVKVEFVG